MDNLVPIMQFLLAALFLFYGFSRILACFARESRLAGSGFLRMGLPRYAKCAIGLFEIAAALLLVLPVQLWQLNNLPQLAAAGLAVFTAAAAIYLARRKESAVPVIALFLMALFVVIGRWP